MSKTQEELTIAEDMHNRIRRSGMLSNSTTYDIVDLIMESYDVKLKQVDNKHDFNNIDAGW
jgi:hypothetical protein